MILHISRMARGDGGADIPVAALRFDLEAHEVAGYEHIPARTAGTARYLDETTVVVEGSTSIRVRGSYDPEGRSVSIQVACGDEPVLTLMAFCAPGAKYSPVAMARLPGGHILTLMVEPDVETTSP